MCPSLSLFFFLFFFFFSFFFRSSSQDLPLGRSPSLSFTFLSLSLKLSSSLSFFFHFSRQCQKCRPQLICCRRTSVPKIPRHQMIQHQEACRQAHRRWVKPPTGFKWPYLTSPTSFLATLCNFRTLAPRPFQGY